MFRLANENGIETNSITSPKNGKWENAMKASKNDMAPIEHNVIDSKDQDEINKF